MKVIIGGGGLGGIATAGYLQQAGVEAVVYEQTPALQQIGAGILLAPNAVRLLRNLGLYSRLEASAVRIETGWEFRRWETGEVLFAQDMARCEALYGEASWTIHRADLLDMLLTAVRPDSIHLGRRLVDAEQDADGVTAVFDDGSTDRGDILVAAEGIHSRLRRELATPRPPRDVGLVAWRALLPVKSVEPFARRPVQTIWLGPGRHLVHYPVSAGTKINIVAFTPTREETVESWVAEGDTNEFAAEFAGWGEPLQKLLRCVGEVGRWAVLDREPIDNYVFGRIALLGDAAHPMVPFFAQGAGQAIEDAVVLATCLTAPGLQIETALAQYNSVRVPRASSVQQVSHARTTYNHLEDGPEQRERDAGFAAEDPLRHSAWLYSYDAQAAARAAVESVVADQRVR